MMRRCNCDARARSVALLACALPVAAHTAAEDLEEIIVTAQRSAENLYRVPISVAVLNEASLRATGAQDLSALANAVPNVSFDGIVTQTGGSTATSIYIRGIGQSDVLQTTDPGVGLFVDGVYVARSVGSLLDVADIERVEVLRGPQGTLFGRNTVGGAINVITRAPADELALTARLTGGSDGRLDAFARVDAPLSTNLRSKLSFSMLDQDGYAFRPNAGDHLGNVHRRAARAELAWTPRESLSITAGADYSRVDESAVAVTLDRVVQMCPAGVANAIGGCDGNAAPAAPISQTYLFNNVPPINRSAGGTGVGISIYDERFVSGDPFINYGTAREASELELGAARLTLDWRGRGIQLRSISAWRAFRAFFSRDTDASPFEVFVPSSKVEQRQVSEELQLFRTNTRLSWVSGVYYLHEAADDDSRVSAAAFDLQSGGRDIISRSAALYGQATWHPSGRIALTAGARYTDEHRSYIPTQSVTRSVTGLPPAGLVIVPPTRNELDFSEPTYRAALEITPSTNLLLYVSWSTGFKSGGFVQRNQVPRPLLPTFDAETVEVFEVGAKAVVLDGRCRLSVAAFTSDYEDLQIRVIEPSTLSPVTSNAGDARIRGGEFEIEVAPHRRVRLAGGLGYLHGRYQSVAPNVPDITLQSRLTDAPEWSENLTLSVSPPWLSDSLSGRIDWMHRSAQFNDAENTPELQQKGFHLLNASATVHCTKCQHRDWSATLGVRNATDERYLVSGYSLAAQGPIGLSYARPREWFIQLETQFR
jgi:iron complex outermembrane receptor protein